MNKVNLVGRITKEIELKYTQNGKAITRFVLAVDRYSNNEKMADFISCVAFGKTAELIERFVKKGQQLAVSGSIKTGSYEKNGTKFYTTDVLIDSITLLGGKSEKSMAEDIAENFRESKDNIPF